jgi:Flp pilus assembly pilin Flp
MAENSLILGPVGPEQGTREKGMNIVALVMRLVDPIRNSWNRREDVLNRKNEAGASLVEYALLLALVAVVAIVALQFLGGTVANTLNSVGNSLA